MESSLQNSLQALLGKYDALSARIKHVDFSVGVMPRISVRGSYVAFRDGIPTIDEFVQVVHERIAPYCLPRSELLQTYSDASAAAPTEAAAAYARLIRKASQLFIKAKQGSHRSGEATEVILYILVEWLLKAPQIVSKMYLKTNSNVPVFGTDGIHVRYDSEAKKLIMYWGESKAHATLTGAFSDALESIAEFLKLGQHQRELEIVHDHMDSGTLSPAEKEAILDFLDPYSEASNARVESFACLLAYDHSNFYSAPENAEESFVKWFEKNATRFVNKLSPRLKRAGLETRRFEFFLLPVESVQLLRDKFQHCIGWPHVA